MEWLVLRRNFSSVGTQRVFDRFFKPIIEASKPKEHAVEQLIKPVGLNKPPRPTDKYSKGNSFKDLFNDEKVQKRTEELTLELSKSGMYDMHTFRKTQGKLFLSPKSYWRSDKALYFPHVVGTAVLMGSKQKPLETVMKGKISVVRIFGNRVGEKLSSEFFQGRDPLADLQWQDENTQLIEISWVENALKSLVMQLSLWSLRSSLSAARQSNYFLCERKQLPFTLRERLHINNLYTGYTLLVDPNLKIRWIASGGVSDPAERDLLWKCVSSLKQEYSMKVKG